jgi:hypothetical protein
MLPTHRVRQRRDGWGTRRSVAKGKQYARNRDRAVAQVVPGAEARGIGGRVEPRLKSGPISGYKSNAVASSAHVSEAGRGALWRVARRHLPGAEARGIGGRVESRLKSGPISGTNAAAAGFVCPCFRRETRGNRQRQGGEGFMCRAYSPWIVWFSATQGFALGCYGAGLRPSKRHRCGR